MRFQPETSFSWPTDETIVTTILQTPRKNETTVTNGSIDEKLSMQRGGGGTFPPLEPPNKCATFYFRNQNTSMTLAESQVFLASSSKKHPLKIAVMYSENEDRIPSLSKTNGIEEQLDVWVEMLLIAYANLHELVYDSSTSRSSTKTWNSTLAQAHLDRVGLHLPLFPLQAIPSDFVELAQLVLGPNLSTLESNPFELRQLHPSYRGQHSRQVMYKWSQDVHGEFLHDREHAVDGFLWIHRQYCKDEEEYPNNMMQHSSSSSTQRFPAVAWRRDTIGDDNDSQHNDKSSKKIDDYIRVAMLLNEDMLPGKFIAWLHYFLDQHPRIRVVDSLLSPGVQVLLATPDTVSMSCLLPPRSFVLEMYEEDDDEEEDTENGRNRMIPRLFQHRYESMRLRDSRFRRELELFLVQAMEVYDVY